MSTQAEKVGGAFAPGGKKLALSEVSLYIGAVAIILVFTVICRIVGRNFLTMTNIQNIITQSSIISVIAIGSSIVILTGGIDLSAGSIVGFVGILAGLLIKAGNPIWVACICMALAGIGFGFASGVLISIGKVPAFITTLGFMQIARGMALLINSGKPISSFPRELGAIMNTKLMGIPLSVLYVFVLYFIIIVVMGHTRFGRHIYAVGGNPNAAKLSGVRTRRIEIAAYVLSGLFAAIGGILLLSRLTYADPNAGAGYEMSAIASTVIGGISLSGGKGKIGNTLVGSLILGSLTCGLQILNVATYYQTIITGLVIIMAVFADKAKERKGE
ncbi:ABC transporter permease [Spirochaetia bacterium]|nr:ABC transporter permease [Spirochaetia bacterium]